MMSATAHIQKFNKNSEGHTEYFIKVLFNGREWAIRKRYSEFIIFDEYLQKGGYKVSYSLPAKTWWKRFDPNVLIQRQKELQSYLDVLLKSTVSTENSLVREFLEVDLNKLALAKKQTYKEFTSNENLENVVASFRKSVIEIPSNKIHVVTTPSVSRNRSLSVFKRINSLGTGYGSGASKNASFSNRPMLRRGETVTSDSGNNNSGSATPSTPGRDRRFSMDLFSQMASASLKDMYLGGGERLTETNHQFVTAVDALWPHYAGPINEAIDELESGGDFPVTVLEPFSDSLSADILALLARPGAQFASLPAPTSSKSSPMRSAKSRSSEGSRADQLEQEAPCAGEQVSSAQYSDLEADLRCLMSETPKYVNRALKSSNPVFSRLPINGGRYGSASTDKSDSLSESISAHSAGSVSTPGSAGSHQKHRYHMDTNVEGAEEDEEEEDERSYASKATHSRDSSVDKPAAHQGISPSSSQESLHNKQ